MENIIPPNETFYAKNKYSVNKSQPPSHQLQSFVFPSPHPFLSSSLSLFIALFTLVTFSPSLAPAQKLQYNSNKEKVGERVCGSRSIVSNALSRYFQGNLLQIVLCIQMHSIYDMCQSVVLAQGDTYLIFLFQLVTTFPFALLKLYQCEKNVSLFFPYPEDNEKIARNFNFFQGRVFVLTREHINLVSSFHSYDYLNTKTMTGRTKDPRQY